MKESTCYHHESNYRHIMGIKILFNLILLDLSDKLRKMLSKTSDVQQQLSEDKNKNLFFVYALHNTFPMFSLYKITVSSTGIMPFKGL